MNEKPPILSKLHSVFTSSFGAPPTITAHAPGRVNLIGEHTDYNDGFVLPMAINRAIFFAASERRDRQVHLEFLDFNSSISFDLDSLQRGPAGPVEYIKGMAHFLEQDGSHIPGLNGVITGDIPISAGLSSSAALELAAARVLCALSNTSWDPVHMAKLAQKAENRWVGISCGIMDQLICASGMKSHALLIDCRSLDMTPTPIPREVTVVVLDSGTRRSGSGLLDSAYGERRMQCEEAAMALGVPALRDATMEDLNTQMAFLDPVVYNRARHVITENERTLAAQRVLSRNDPASMGRLMNASHESLQYDFEVSTPALDSIAEIARSHPACWGARMTGGGFGGCAVALVNTSQVDEFMMYVQMQYGEQTNLESHLYACQAGDGASLLS